MNCTQSKNLLDDYVDGSLSAILLSNVQAHLKNCNECKDVFTQANNLLIALKDMPVPPPQNRI